MTGEMSDESLRERTRSYMRAEIANTAIDLFLAHGFDATTTDDIVAAAGVSRRTFFRYFPGKEDTVLEVVARLAAEGCQRFVERPAEQTTWEAMGASVRPFIEWVHSDRDRALAMLKLINETPALRASFLDRLDRWRHSLTSVVAARLGVGPDGLRPALIAAVAIAVFDVAVLAWAAGDGRADLDDVFTHALRAVQIKQDL